MAEKLPEVKHIYQYWVLDSTHWDFYQARDDDIIIATPYKSGTTWMQTIVQRLVFMDTENRILKSVSPWIDKFNGSKDIAMIEAQQHRRFLKSHLPLDGLPYYPQVKYIVVSRDARDVFMSLWNHHRNQTRASLEQLTARPERKGPPLPPCPDDIREFWRDWITKGTFEWETEGYPWWSNLRHVQTWWDFRHLPNIFFVHFNDLLKDLEGEIRRIANYLDIVIPEELVSPIVESVTFKYMKQNGEQITGDLRNIIGGAQTFFHKGTNGRWRDVLTEDDLKLYEAAVKCELTPDCVKWLENGRLGL